MPRQISIRQPIYVIGPSIAYIPLTKGQFALVDRENAEYISQWNWHAHFAKTTQSFYAQRAISTGSNPRQKNIGMANVIMKTPNDLQCDHIYHQTLHNIEVHLRNVTRRQNMTNSAKTRSSCGFRGVAFNTHKKKWQATIRIEGNRLFLGYFSNPQEAGERYAEAAKIHHGDFRYVESA